MNCPRCQLPIDDANVASCPRCGYALQAPPEPGMRATPDAASDASVMSPTVPSPPVGPLPGYGTPPSGSMYGPGMPGMYGPGVPPPPYPPYPPYPLYPQYQQPYPPSPMYSPYGAPPYGAPAPGTIPLAVPPGWAPAAPPKRRHSALIALAVLLLVVVVAGSGAALYFVANGTHGPNISLVQPTATPGETPILIDPLKTNTYRWLVNSHCFFADGGYHVKGNYWCSAPVGTVGDCDVSVQVQEVADSFDTPYGLVAHITDTGDLYGFVINSAGRWAFFKSIGNGSQFILQYAFSSAIKQGLHVTNTIEMRVIGSHFTFYANGTTLGQADDSSLSNGYIGVTAGENAEAVFNNFAASIPY